MRVFWAHLAERQTGKAKSCTCPLNYHPIKHKRSKRATPNGKEKSPFLGPVRSPICLILKYPSTHGCVSMLTPLFSSLRWFLSPCHVTYGTSARAGTPTRSRTERTTTSTPWGDQTDLSPPYGVPGRFAPAWHSQCDRSGPLPSSLLASNFLHMLLNRHTSPSVPRPRQAEKACSSSSSASHKDPERPGLMRHHRNPHFSATRKVILQYLKIYTSSNGEGGTNQTISKDTCKKKKSEKKKTQAKT